MCILRVPNVYGQRLDFSIARSLRSRTEQRVSLKKMIYIKSLLVGTLTLLLSVVIYVVISFWFMSRKYAALISSGVEISFDLSSLVYSPLFWLVAVSGFALGFVWMFRSAAR